MTTAENSAKSPCSVCNKTGDTSKCSKCKDISYCGRDCQKKDWKRHKKFCDDGKEPESGVAKVRVRVSRRHGKGLFAVDDIAQGEKICFFAGEDCDAAVKVTVTKSEAGVLSIKEAEKVFKALMEDASTVDRCLSHPDPIRRSVRIGDSESESRFPPFGLGQFINDAEKPDLGFVEEYEEARKELQRYEASSRSAANCQVKGAKYWFIATKDIKSGDEILTHYGCEFWLHKAMLDCKAAEKRFLFYSLQEQDGKPFNLRNCFNYDKRTCAAFLRHLIRVHEEEDVEDLDPMREIIHLTEKIKIL